VTFAHELWLAVKVYDCHKCCGGIFICKEKSREPSESKLVYKVGPSRPHCLGGFLRPKGFDFGQRNVQKAIYLLLLLGIQGKWWSKFGMAYLVGIVKQFLIDWHLSLKFLFFLTFLQILMMVPLKKNQNLVQILFF